MAKKTRPQNPKPPELVDVALRISEQLEDIEVLLNDWSRDVCERLKMLEGPAQMTDQIAADLRALRKKTEEI